MKPVILDYTVTEDQMGRYISLPFSVPDGVDAVSVSYAYSKKAEGKQQPKTVIDLGLEDGQGRFLGWSGSDRSTITVGEFDATPGYLMGPVRAGTWHILLGAYRIPPQGVSVRYEISFQEKGPAWLFGDLHTHSDASDGQYDIPTLAKLARSKGLDFLAVTNHNNYAENFSLPKIQGLTLIPGVEWTHYLGHMNFLGVRQPFSGSFVANDLEQMRRITAEARKSGALVSVNHPKCTQCPYLWEDDGCFQAIEIWNGPMRGINRDGIRWWTGFLRQGRRIPAVGGSDFHRDHQAARLGNPVTAVYADSRAAEDILSAAAQGRSYITSGVRGVRLGADCQEKTFGDVLADGRQTHRLTVQADNMPAGSVLRLIGSRGEAARLKPKGGHILQSVTVSDTAFVYLLAAYSFPGAEDWPLAVSNPIYFA